LSYHDGIDYDDEISEISNDRYFGPNNCKYDLAGEALVQLAISEYIALILVEFSKNLLRKIFLAGILGRSNW
jgi:hypothetical protein